MYSNQRFMILFAVLCLAVTGASGQKIVYSDYEKDDTRRMNFEIIGKMNGNFLVYKNLRNEHVIAVLDNDMKQIAREEHDYLPDDRIINVEFFAYPDFSYLVYQYQKKSVVYCMAVKVDAMGKKAGEPLQLDSTHIGFSASNRIYNVISSEDKSKILVFKINSKNRRRYLLTTVLFDSKLELLKRSSHTIGMDDNREYLEEYHVDNDGDFVFTKFYRTNSDNITQASLITKAAQSDSLVFRDLNLKDYNLDEIHVKVDNFNKRYFLSSFYYQERRGNIEGMYFYVWDKGSNTVSLERRYEFNEDLKREARGEAGTRMAFNDYFIRNLITKKDGGFIIASEAYYTSSRFNNWNRWDYLYGSPFISPMDYYYFNSGYNRWWWPRSMYGNNNQSVRYHADNIAVMSFDKTGEPEWTNIITKSQYDDETDNMVSYYLMNTGGQLHFLFNKPEKRVQLLSDYTVDPEGKINRNPTLKNLDKGFEFMPKYAKQVSARQTIMPCLYRNYICFAKIEYN